MKQAYIEKRFTDASLLTIAQANMIIDEYTKDGLKLTLRQLYYQFVSRGWMANLTKEYNRLGALISDARLAGLVDWNAIEDRTRSLKELSHWDNPGSIIRACAYSFMLDHWAGQTYRPEVWIEKEALAGVIQGICDSLDVPYFACKGYVSQSEMWRAGQRLKRWAQAGATPVIIHLGDHDPSGIDMTRDNRDRLSMFSFLGDVGGIDVERIALNMNQVDQYSPPPNPAKITDSRAVGYIAKYGRESWELDALEPKVLRDLIAATVLKYRDEDQYQKVLDLEEKYKRVLLNVAKNWQSL